MEYLFAALVAERIVAESLVSRNLMRITGARISDIMHLPVAVDFLAELIKNSEKMVDSVLPPRRQQRDIALKLLNATRDDLGGWFGRVELFTRAYARSLNGMSEWRRVLAIVAGPAMLPFWFMLFATFWFSTNELILIFANKKAAAADVRRIVAMARLMAFASGPLLLLLPIRRWRYRRAAFWLWNVLCKRLEIGDEVLHLIAGTRWLPWARRQRFDYFLPCLP